MTTSSLTFDEEISLERLLAARDARYVAQTQKRLGNPGVALIVLTVVMPGKVKRTRETVAIGKAAIDEIKTAVGMQITEAEIRDLPTGFEAFFIVRMPSLDAKLAMCEIETRHPLGRLFDIDVIGEDGMPIPRSAVGLEARHCLLCGNDARICMRKHAHSYDELINHIRQLVSEYEQQRL